MSRKIVVTSGKGGVGKTTVSAFLGYALAVLNEKVVVVDLDMGLNNLDIVLNMEQKVVYDLIDVLNDKCRLKQALIQDRETENLFVLPCSRFVHPANFSDKITQLISKLEEFFSFIIIDCPAGIDTGFYNAIKVADEALVVVNPHISSLRDSDKVLNLLASSGISSKLIVNRTRGDLVLRRQMLTLSQISKHLKTRVVGVIPESDQLLLGGQLRFKNQMSLVEKSFYVLAKNLIYDKYEVVDYCSAYRGILGRIRRNFRKNVG